MGSPLGGKISSLTNSVAISCHLRLNSYYPSPLYIICGIGFFLRLVPFLFIRHLLLAMRTAHFLIHVLHEKEKPSPDYAIKILSSRLNLGHMSN